MLTVNHLLSWDWAIFIFYPYPLPNLLIFWISQSQTALKTIQSGLTPPFFMGRKITIPLHSPSCLAYISNTVKGMLLMNWVKQGAGERQSKPMSIQQGQEGQVSVGWQNTPTPECFTAISDRTWFGLKVLPVCNFSKQKHWSACAEAEKGIKLKYHCCFADNLCQQHKLWLGVGGCPGHVSGWTCTDLVFQFMPWISCQVQRHLFILVKIPQSGWSQILGALP